MSKKSELSDIYETLKDLKARVINHRLTIDGFSAENYEDLYFLILEALNDHIAHDYDAWYRQTAWSYHRFRGINNHNHDWYDPHISRDPMDQDIREQLCVLRFYLMRRHFSNYSKKCEEE